MNTKKDNINENNINEESFQEKNEKIIITTEEIKDLTKSYVDKKLTDITSQYDKYIKFLHQQLELQNSRYEALQSSLARKEQFISDTYSDRIKDIFIQFIKTLDTLYILKQNISLNKNTDENSKMIKNSVSIFFETVDSEIFHKYNISKIEIEVDKTLYDPKYHYAISTNHKDNIEENIIISVLKDGFIYNKNEILRQSIVIINKKTE